MTKPKLSFWQIWNLSFGFLGVQIGYSLQNSNTSSIFESLGADVSHLSYFWLAAPLAGMIVLRLCETVVAGPDGIVSLHNPLFAGAVFFFAETFQNVYQRKPRGFFNFLVSVDKRKIKFFCQSFANAGFTAATQL